MKYLPLFSFCLVSSLYSISVDTIVLNTLNNNNSIKSINEKIISSQQDILLANKWSNPIFSFGINDITLSDPLTRDKEAMQAQYIGFSQTITSNSKLNLKNKIAIQDKNIIEENLYDRKLILKSKIYELSFNIVFLEKQVKLLNKKLNYINKIEKLLNNSYSFNNINPNSILSLNIQKNDLEVLINNLNTTLSNLYLNLENISFTKIDNIENIKTNFNLNINLDNHPILQKLNITKEKYLNISSLEKENKIGDPKLNLTYFNRDNKFDDYINLSINIPISLYEIENIKSEKNRVLSLKTNYDLQDKKREMETNIRILKNNMNSSYTNYKLLEQKTLPILSSLEENLKNYYSLKNINIEEIIKTINTTIIYKIKLLQEENKFNTYYSQLLYYQGHL